MGLMRTMSSFELMGAVWVGGVGIPVGMEVGAVGVEVGADVGLVTSA